MSPTRMEKESESEKENRTCHEAFVGFGAAAGPLTAPRLHHGCPLDLVVLDGLLGRLLHGLGRGLALHAAAPEVLDAVQPLARAEKTGRDEHTRDRKRRKEERKRAREKNLLLRHKPRRAYPALSHFCHPGRSSRAHMF